MEGITIDVPHEGKHVRFSGLTKEQSDVLVGLCEGNTLSTRRSAMLQPKERIEDQIIRQILEWRRRNRGGDPKNIVINEDDCREIILHHRENMWSPVSYETSYGQLKFMGIKILRTPDLESGEIKLVT